MGKWEMSKLITRALLWLFTRSVYLAEIDVPVQGLIPQATTVSVASVTAKYPWSCLSFEAFCGYKSINNDIRSLHWASLKVYRGKISYLLQQKAVDIQDRVVFPRYVLQTSFELQLKSWDTYSAWREISVEFSSSMFCSYFLNSHKLLTSPASCGNELHSFNCILCEVFFFLMLSKICHLFISFNSP